MSRKGESESLTRHPVISAFHIDVNQRYPGSFQSFLTPGRQPTFALVVNPATHKYFIII
jgi:hypothetical protein